MYRSFVSFEADRGRFPTTGRPPGAELARWVSDALDAASLPHEGPHEREGWAWELYRVEGKVTVVSIVGLSDDGPRQWQVHTYATIPVRRRLLSRRAGRSEREDALRPWCSALDRALKGDPAFGNVRWYDPEAFDRDHGETWADSPG